MTGTGGETGRQDQRGAPLGVGMLVVSIVFLIVTLCVVAAGPAGYRLGTLELETATLGVARSALIAAAGTAVAALVGIICCLLARKPRGVIVGLLALTAAAMIGFRAYSYQIDRENLPPINDAQTDWDRPVAFSEATLRAREQLEAAPIRDDGAVPDGYGRWSGMGFAAAQAVVYDDIGPLQVNLPPAETTVVAANAAKRLGWSVMLTDPPNGQVEATTYSRWYGLGADIAVRVTASEGGARVDARSASRETGPDMGANAGHIRALLNEIAFLARGS